MIDIQLIRDDSERVKQKSAQKGVAVDTDKILELDKQIRTLKHRIDKLRQLQKLNAELMHLNNQITAQEAVLGPIIEGLKKGL